MHVSSFTAYSSCTPTRGQSDTRSSGSHSDIGSNPADHRGPSHPPSGIHRAAFTWAPALSQHWETPSDILCSESTLQGWPDPAHPRPDSFQPSGLIPSTPVWLNLTAILDAFGPKHTSSLSFSAKGVQHLMACRTDARQIMKWFQPTCLFQSQLSSWLTRPDDTLLFWQRHCLYGQPLGWNSSDRPERPVQL